VLEMNAGFPPNASARWILHSTRPFASAEEAYLAETRALELLRADKSWIGGEFSVVEPEKLSLILGNSEGIP